MAKKSKFKFEEGEVVEMAQSGGYVYTAAKSLPKKKKPIIASLLNAFPKKKADKKFALILERYEKFELKIDWRVFDSAGNSFKPGDKEVENIISLPGPYYKVICEERIHDFCPETMFRKVK